MECYVDTEAVRIDHGQESGLKHLFKEVHQRYDMPMALTEVQLHCTREEQLRWFKEAWNTCRILNEEGAQIKAVTAWSLFGAYGWNTLLTTPDGEYEPGVFDLRSPEPRPTALFNLIRSINTDGDFIHPLLSQKGWWHREQRFLHNRLIVSQDSEINHSATPVLIIGKNGVLGQAFAQSCEARAIPYHLAGRDEIDLSGEKLMNEVIEKYRPWAVINTGGYIDIDEAEKCPERCYSDIIKGPQLLSALCKKNGIKFVAFSREVVFSGKKATPYVESDNTDPVNVLGRSKVEMETLVLRSDPASLIIRTGEFFGSMNNNNFVSRLINTLRSGKQFNVAGEIIVSPAYLPDLVNISLDLMIDDEHGIWHLANQGHMTLSDLAYEVAERAGLKKQLLLTQKTASMPWVAKRPLNSSLASEKSSLMPSLHNALDRFFHEYYNDHSLQAAGCTVR
jgi:dTDP-4-dehydrorhamnose reductase